MDLEEQQPIARRYKEKRKQSILDNSGKVMAVAPKKDLVAISLQCVFTLDCHT